MENQNISQNLSAIEEELQDLLKSSKSTWTQIASLMMNVQDNELHKPKSYTQWVEGMAKQAGVHVSLLWSRLQAGRTWMAHEKACQTKNVPCVSMAESKLSAESLVYINKVAGNNEEIRTDLINKSISGELSRKDLAQAWAKKRYIEGAKTSRHANGKKKGVKAGSVFDASTVKFLLINRIKDWIQPPKGGHINSSFADVCEKYQHFYEFPVSTGSTRSARRIDFLAIENVTSKDLRRLNIHACEVKVDANDLKGDHKMAEYEDFADYCWLAVPPELLSDAVERINEDSPWGILVVTREEGVSIERQAEKRPGARRAETLETCVLKNIKTYGL